MLNRLIAILMLHSAVLCCSACMMDPKSSTGTNEMSPASTLVSGMVTSSGAGLSGVRVFLTGARSGTAVTDANGNYTITGVADGSYSLIPSRSGYTFSPSSLSAIVSGANVTGKNFTAALLPVTPGTVNLPKTGQTTCYDTAGSVVSCATSSNAGQDGALQRSVAWPNPRFMDNGNSTMTDNLTGLVWTKDANAPGPVACGPGPTITWQGALDYVSCLNTNAYLGFSDWRLPNRKELRSLVNTGEPNTAAWLNTQGFANAQASYYWSSSTYAFIPVYAWYVDMGDGHVFNYYKHKYYHVWPVRSGQ